MHVDSGHVTAYKGYFIYTYSDLHSKQRTHSTPQKARRIPS